MFGYHLKVSLFGRPNSGKSTLFNILANEQRSLVSPTPHFTRDVITSKVYEALPVPLVLSDTPGVERLARGSLSAYQEQTLKDSKIVLFVFDSQKDVEAEDRELLSSLRKLCRDQTIMVVANKADNEEIISEQTNEVFSLGDENPHFVSAKNGLNIHDLLESFREFVTPEMQEEYKAKLSERKAVIAEAKKRWLRNLFKGARDARTGPLGEEFDRLNRAAQFESELEESSAERILLYPKVQDTPGVSFDSPYKNLAIKIALIGRPNVGKSSLFNALLSQERSTVCEEAQTTRDPVTSSLLIKGRRAELIDTAGETKKLEKGAEEDKKVVGRSREFSKFAQINVVVLDALHAFRERDYMLLQRAIKEGRALVIAVNKWDLVDDKWKEKAKKFIIEQMKRHLGSEKTAPIVTVSARTGENLPKLLDAVLLVYESWNARISTGLLNDWLHRFKKLSENDYKSYIKKQDLLKIRYITQTNIRPPSFTLFVNEEEMFQQHALKFFKSKLIEEFKLYGVPVRIKIKDVRHKMMKKRVLAAMRGRPMPAPKWKKPVTEQL